MPARKHDFELTQANAEKIVQMLDLDPKTQQPKSKLSDICKVFDIEHRALNSAICQAIFTPKPTPAQQLLRVEIMDIIFTQTYMESPQ